MKKIIITLSIILLSFLLIGCSQETTSGNAVKEESDEINIPMSELSSQVKYYEHENTGIKYFAVLGSDGLPRVAFDGCEVCGGAKGYQQDGGDIVCRNCGRAFSIDELGTANKGAGCWPGYLPIAVQGDNIVIKEENIMKGSYMFR